MRVKSKSIKFYLKNIINDIILDLICYNKVKIILYFLLYTNDNEESWRCKICVKNLIKKYLITHVILFLT